MAPTSSNGNGRNWTRLVPVATLILALITGGAVVVLPLIAAYTVFVYWLFRGKVADAGHH